MQTIRGGRPPVMRVNLAERPPYGNYPPPGARPPRPGAPPSQGAPGYRYGKSVAFEFTTKKCIRCANDAMGAASWRLADAARYAGKPAMAATRWRTWWPSASTTATGGLLVDTSTTTATRGGQLILSTYEKASSFCSHPAFVRAVCHISAPSDHSFHPLTRTLLTDFPL